MTDDSLVMSSDVCMSDEVENGDINCLYIHSCTEINYKARNDNNDNMQSLFIHFAKFVEKYQNQRKPLL